MSDFDAELAARIDAAVPNVDDEPGPEPCYECECCAIWLPGLELLRDSIKAHVAGELRVAPCSSECLVCASVEWQG